MLLCSQERVTKSTSLTLIWLSNMRECSSVIDTGWGECKLQSYNLHPQWIKLFSLQWSSRASSEQDLGLNYCFIPLMKPSLIFTCKFPNSHRQVPNSQSWKIRCDNKRISETIFFGIIFFWNKIASVIGIIIVIIEI